MYTPLVAFSLMAFYVFALMCTSTLAVTVQRDRWRRARRCVGGAAVRYMLALAYGTALLVYQGGLALGLGGGA